MRGLRGYHRSAYSQTCACRACLKHRSRRTATCGTQTSPPSPATISRTLSGGLRFGAAGGATFIREGGTIPVGLLFKRLLNIDTLFVGFGLPDDRVHSPNEKFDLDALHQGTRTAAVLYEKLSRL